MTDPTSKRLRAWGITDDAITRKTFKVKSRRIFYSIHRICLGVFSRQCDKVQRNFRRALSTGTTKCSVVFLEIKFFVFAIYCRFRFATLDVSIAQEQERQTHHPVSLLLMQLIHQVSIYARYLQVLLKIFG